MKNRTAWIAVVLALGLILGAVVTTTGAIEGEANVDDLDQALSSASLVDCGFGREALLEPVTVDGRTSFKIRCVAMDPDEAPSARDARPAATSPVVVMTPAPEPRPSRDEASVSPPAAVAATPEPDSRDERGWKESAVVIGGAAGTGAGIGALAKGKKGAVVGAAIGAASGAAYELIKKDRKP